MRPPAPPRVPRRPTEPATPQHDDHPERHDATSQRPTPRSLRDRLPGVPRPKLSRDRNARGRELSTSPDDRQRAGHNDQEFLQRQAEQERARKRLVWRRVAIAGGAAVLLAALAWLVLVSPLLALRTTAITVSGSGQGTTVPTEDVKTLAAEHAGTPLARLDSEAVAAEISAMTSVAKAEVHRSWPTGLHIEVVARNPVAIGQDGEEAVLLDAEGVALGPPGQDTDLPTIDVPLEDDALRPTLQAVLRVLGELPSDLTDSLSSASATSPAAITLELDDGAQVHWGDATESKLKAAVLDVLRQEEAATYDLTEPRAPTTTS